jgi:hypothetical protein
MSKEINYEKIALIRMKAQSNHEITISLQIEFSILTPQAQYRDGIEGMHPWQQRRDQEHSKVHHQTKHLSILM